MRRRTSSAVVVASLIVFTGGLLAMRRSPGQADIPEGPRQAAWEKVEKNLREGRPRSASAALEGLAEAAIADRSWAEAARAIATRVLADTADRPGDDPQRLIELDAAIAAAPAETRSVLETVAANWTWRYFQENRWRFIQRTSGAVISDDLAEIASWDLPQILEEINRRFERALAEADTLQQFATRDWRAIIDPGAMFVGEPKPNAALPPEAIERGLAIRPTVFDVVIADAIDFYASGERGLVAPEDTFEADAAGPMLGTIEEFLAWQPAASTTDVDSPLLAAIMLHQQRLAFHRHDADPTALLHADLERIAWATNVVVDGEDDLTGVDERINAAWQSLIERAGDREVATYARARLADLLTTDLATAHAVASLGASAHPDTVGGAMCKNRIAFIETPELNLASEASWAEPWPVLQVDYQNLERVYLRIVKADWRSRLAAARPEWQWLDEQEHAAILSATPERSMTIDLPATPDYHPRTHDVPVPQDLPPGSYWVVASGNPGFSGDDNVVSICMVWVTRLAMVTDSDAARSGQPRKEHPDRRNRAALEGHVVDIRSGEPIEAATVTAFTPSLDDRQPTFRATATTSTDADGRFQLSPASEGPQPGDTVLVATTTLDGVEHTITSGRVSSSWRRGRPVPRHVVLVTDRGLHRPGQIVHYKGIGCIADTSDATYQSLDGLPIKVTFRDANGREVSTAEHVTSRTGSFHGTFSIPSGALPGQWAITAEGEGATGVVGVRVEEYKRPKFLVSLDPPGEAAVLDGEVRLAGKAETYTGLPVAGGRVSWEVKREVRFSPWCRWFFPWLPFDAGAARIAHGVTTTAADGSFAVSFRARPDRSVPSEALPVFTFAIDADVTDAAGETRSVRRSMRAGYTRLEADLSAEEWQAADRGQAEVAITIATRSLDGEPRPATGTLLVERVVQPAEVARTSFFFRNRGFVVPMSRFSRPNSGMMFAVPPEGADMQPIYDPAEPETWPSGERVFSAEQSTDAATGELVARVPLEPGLYRARFEIPSTGGVPAIKATRLIEVIDPAADRYGVRRALTVASASLTVAPGETFQAVVGTGYESGRVLVELMQGGRLLSRSWSEPGRTQWPVTMPVEEQHRGGFTLRVWMVRDGRLHLETRVIDVPWTNKKLDVTWERFTRRLTPGTHDVWRARVTTTPETVHPDAMPAAVEMLAVLYDQSLDALAPHAWPTEGLLGLFRSEQSLELPSFSNDGVAFHDIRGIWDTQYFPFEMRMPALIAELGSPLSESGFGRMRGLGGMGGMVARGGGIFGAENFAMATAAPADAAMDGVEFREKTSGVQGYVQAEAADDDGLGEPPATGESAAPPPPRRNLAETAFFLPSLVSGDDGIVTIEFTLPDTLTTWQFKALAHDASLRSGVLTDTAIAIKDLMVEPVMPRFLREGDRVRIPVKLSNRSAGRLSGTVRFALSDARTGADRSSLIVDAREQAFDLAAGESQPAFFTIDVADGTQALTYLATGSAGRAADGEEGMLPVLSRRVLVAESVPLTLRGDARETVTLEKLAEASPDITNESLVVQVASNPAWYAVLAMPSLMEKTDEGIDALFERLFTNSLARHLVTSDPRIARVFEQWRGTEALESPLAKNSELMSTLLAETPWVRDAVDEREARARIGLLFDATRTDNETRAALDRLASLHNPDGGWPWFPGGRSCDAVTLAVVAGFGRLRTQGVAIDAAEALRALPWVDARLLEEAARGRKLIEAEGNDAVAVTPIGVFALYARSFFLEDQPPSDEVREAMRFCLSVGRRSWPMLTARRTQAQLAIALARAGDRDTAVSIIDSLRERAVAAPGTPEADLKGVAWQGMWWRDPHPAWWSWQGAPIQTQASLIEAFDEVAGDAASVEAMKAWLLSQKRTSQWPGSSATASAIAALLGRGDDLLRQPADVRLQIGGREVAADRIEAGTGFFETRRVGGEITADDAVIVFERKAGSPPSAGFAWGGVHWQYLDDIDHVEAAGTEQLAIEKRLFVRRVTKAGGTLEPIDATTPITVGDEIVVRLVVTSDRDYEFLELVDHRPSLTEPADVLSGWRWGDGVGWYLAVRDTSTQFFFERMPRGTHVLEYSLRAAHAGEASSGFARLQSRYAPEFSARSASIPVKIEPAAE